MEMKGGGTLSLPLSSLTAGCPDTVHLVFPTSFAIMSDNEMTVTTPIRQ